MANKRITLTVGGDVQAKGGTYLRRPADEQLLRACLSGEFAYVLACRQIGKSSLKNAVAECLANKGVRVARIDLNRIGRVKDPESWFFSLQDEISRILKVNIDVEKWDENQPRRSTVTQRFLRFLADVILKEIRDPVVIFFDEIDVILNLPFTGDFFAAIRSIYNDRAQFIDFCRLTFIMLGVAAPDKLINDPKRTPFNIGRAISLTDFTLDESIILSDAIEEKFPGLAKDFFIQVYGWTGGHPYLTQRICEEIVNSEPKMVSPHLVDNLVRELYLNKKDRSSDSNIQFVRKSVLSDEEALQMLRIYREILVNGSIQDDEESSAVYMLKLYGLVVSENACLRVRNRIYEKIFDSTWTENNLYGVLSKRPIYIGTPKVGGSVSNDVGGSREEVDGDGNIVIAREGATVVIGESPQPLTEVDRESALGRYLGHVLARNRYLQLQGIRTGGRLVNIEVERIHMRLRGTQRRLIGRRDDWLWEEAQVGFREPGMAQRVFTETVNVSVEEALRAHSRLVVLGDPGCGKTTLVRYLARVYAQDLADGNTRISEILGTGESERLPIVLQARQFSVFLRSRPDDGTEGHAVLLEFLVRSLANERILVRGDFFDVWLTQGRAVLFVDGLDEILDPELRHRVSRAIEAFVRVYPSCRYLVTSRIVGYTGSARLGESFATMTVGELSIEDMRSFLTNWQRLVAVGQMGAGESAKGYAAEQTRQLMDVIEGNEHIRDLAINPLMLTVIAMVHRDRVKLPDRRAELYAEAVDVLLGSWDEAKGVQEILVLQDRPFDTADKRLMLQAIALYMHEREIKEIDTPDLLELLQILFGKILGGTRDSVQAAKRFIEFIRERTGLLVDRGRGVYGFSHLTFQEYLAALAVAARDDFLDYSLHRLMDYWWREVILLEAGYLSTQSRERTTRLVRSIIEQRSPNDDPYHNLVLAAECLKEVGTSRVLGSLEQEIRRKLHNELVAPPPTLARWFKTTGVRGWIDHRARAMNALVRIDAGFWKLPYGEPNWIHIPAGTFWMGSARESNDEQPAHKLELPEFSISPVPITNIQYCFFIKHTGHEAPRHWQEDRPPKELYNHPVVGVSWYDALAYCEWLTQITGKMITLPTEAQWEKAARGEEKRQYPWGEVFDMYRCNSKELGISITTPVGIFPEGSSYYGCLDMAGNVLEWTQSILNSYPYDPRDVRENVEAANDERRVLRGGSYGDDDNLTRCSARFAGNPRKSNEKWGFRIVLLNVNEVL